MNAGMARRYWLGKYPEIKMPWFGESSIWGEWKKLKGLSEFTGHILIGYLIQFNNEQNRHGPAPIMKLSTWWAKTVAILVYNHANEGKIKM